MSLKNLSETKEDKSYYYHNYIHARITSWKDMLRICSQSNQNSLLYQKHTIHIIVAATNFYGSLTKYIKFK